MPRFVEEWVEIRQDEALNQHGQHPQWDDRPLAIVDAQLVIEIVKPNKMPDHPQDQRYNSIPKRRQQNSPPYISCPHRFTI